MLRAELRRLVSVFEAEHGDLVLERLDGEDASYERMQESLQSLPFLASRKLVVLQAPSANKQFAENAQKLLVDVPETTDVIIIEPKLDKRLAYYKFLKKQKGYTEFNELDETGLSRWLVAQAQEKGSKLSLADAKYLIARVGASQQILASEIEKLTLFTDDITRSNIDNMTVAAPQSSIFQLLEAAFTGNTKQTLALYGEQRALKVEPQQIIAMLAWQLHVLALVKSAGASGGAGASGPARTPDTIAREAKLNPYVVKKTAGIARGLTMARTREMIHDLVVIDGRLKRESLDGDDVMLEYLIELSK